MSGSLNLSSIFPGGCCEDPVTWEQGGICCDSCDLWFHKDCVDMRSFTFLAYSTTNVSWICCRCNHSNFDRNLFYSFEIETTNNFDNLNSSGSENVVNSPNSDFTRLIYKLIAKFYGLKFSDIGIKIINPRLFL